MNGLPPQLESLFTIPALCSDDGIIYKVPKGGIVNTSSSYDFGWVNENHSGSYQLYDYYVDENGTIIEEVPKENIRFGPNGSTQAEGKAEKYFDYQIFGSEEVEKDGCPALGF